MGLEERIDFYVTLDLNLPLLRVGGVYLSTGVPNMLVLETVDVTMGSHDPVGNNSPLGGCNELGG